MTDSSTTLTDAREPTEWNLPDSEICSAALALVNTASPAALVNHCVRSYVFGREIAAAQGLQSGVDYDDETLYLACLLHDLGLTDYGSGDQRFEVEGADAAARFLREHGGVDDQAITTIWQSIALHSSLGLGHRFGTVQAISTAGISFDVDGMGMENHSPDFIERVTTTWPRHGLGHALGDAIARDIRAHPNNPMKAPPFSLPGHLNEALNGAPAIVFSDVIANAAWRDRSEAK